jgi:hypothetical protein
MLHLSLRPNDAYLLMLSTVTYDNKITQTTDDNSNGLSSEYIVQSP